MADDANAAPLHDAAEAAPAIAAGPRSTHFRFAHRLFAVKGALFRLSPTTDEPVLFVKLGELDAALTLPTLAREFGLDPGTEDARLLETAAQGLRYVKEIRPGDSIPRELLDGTSSWTLEPRHQDRAQARLTLGLAGRRDAPDDPERLAAAADEPETRARADAALKDAAGRLAPGAAGAAAAGERFDALIREFAYVEALRDRFALVRMIERKIAQTFRAFRDERSVTDEIQRIQVLIKAPLEGFAQLFRAADARAAEILAALKDPDPAVDAVRATRDEIAQRLVRWDDMIARWEKLAIARGEPLDQALKATYRFVARHFPQKSDWTLTVNRI